VLGGLSQDGERREGYIKRIGEIGKGGKDGVA